MVKQDIRDIQMQFHDLAGYITNALDAVVASEAELDRERISYSKEYIRKLNSIILNVKANKNLYTQEEITKIKNFFLTSVRLLKEYLYANTELKNLYKKLINKILNI